MGRYAQAEGASETRLRAKEAWDRGEFDSAEPLYKEALDRGGLSPVETLDCFVHLGAARAVMGRKAAALVAFRQAALLDPRFLVPSEAGKKAVTIANQARREEAKTGAFHLRLEVPETANANKPFRVAATIDPAHAAFISRVGIVARDQAGETSYEKSEPATTSVGFEVPGSVALPNAVLTIRLDALDGHDNRLASVEKRVRIGAATTGTASGEPSATAPDWSKPIPPEKKDSVRKDGGGFWSSPWPYVIGGVALAAGGAAVYLGTRPTDDVSIGVASVRVR